MVASARAYISALNKMIGWMSVAQKVVSRGKPVASIQGVSVAMVTSTASAASIDEAGSSSTLAASK